jgi:aryl-alcohol dehydrogenase-like predicted oxidoreductase
MEYRRFGKTDLNVSVVGFGAWGIGGPAMVGSTPIGWGEVDDATSKKALLKSKELGINFFDTADFYGLGHSEDLIGEVFGNDPDVVIATKVGHRATPEKTIALDYSKQHILTACDMSLKRLRRETIDYYQLHSARMPHFEQGECIEAMEQLKNEGKIRYWGLSLNTFKPEAESEFLISRHLADGFQLVFNVINQRALGVIAKAAENGYGVIARMPLQFGLLTGKFSRKTTFTANDHRSFRLTEDILDRTLTALEDVWTMAHERKTTKTTLALSYCAGTPGISTIIPGIKTPEQAVMNSAIVSLSENEKQKFFDLYRERFSDIVALMESQG